MDTKLWLLGIFRFAQAVWDTYNVTDVIMRTEEFQAHIERKHRKSTYPKLYILSF